MSGNTVLRESLDVHVVGEASEGEASGSLERTVGDITPFAFPIEGDPEDIFKGLTALDAYDLYLTEYERVHKELTRVMESSKALTDLAVQEGMVPSGYANTDAFQILDYGTSLEKLGRQLELMRGQLSVDSKFLREYVDEYAGITQRTPDDVMREITPSR